MQPQKPLQWHIQQNNESLVVQLSGDLTRNTLLPLWEQRASFLSPRGNQQIYWDLKALSGLDSAGFTLLAELLNHYQQQTNNNLINPPAILFTLADLYALQHWFEPFLISTKS